MNLVRNALEKRRVEEERAILELDHQIAVPFKDRRVSSSSLQISHFLRTFSLRFRVWLVVCAWLIVEREFPTKFALLSRQPPPSSIPYSPSRFIHKSW